MSSQAPSAALVLKRREATTVELLGIECDGHDTPIALHGEKPDSWWIAKRADFSGPASAAATGEVVEGSIGVHSTALAITAKHLLGIIAPDDFTAAALWFALPLAEFQIKTEGSKGLLRKRPATITLSMDSSKLNLSGIIRLWRNSGSAQPWQEKAFVEALAP